MYRLIREVSNNILVKQKFLGTSRMTYEGCRFTKQALEAIHTAVEAEMINRYQKAIWCMKHAKRVTLMVQDWNLVTRFEEDEKWVANDNQK